MRVCVIMWVQDVVTWSLVPKMIPLKSLEKLQSWMWMLVDLGGGGKEDNQPEGGGKEDNQPEWCIIQEEGPEGELQKDLEGELQKDMKGLEGELQKDLERIDAPPAHWRTASVTAPILRSGKHAKRISLLHISLVSLVYFANPTRCALPSAAGGAAIINTMMINILQI